MGYGAKRLVQIYEEKMARKAERERIRAEKKKAKELEKKKARQKKLKAKRNHRAYMKRTEAERQMRKAIKDEKAFFMVIITKNRKRIKRLAAKWWKSDAYKVFTDAIEKNRKDVLFPTNSLSKKIGKTRRKTNLEYEILLVKKTNDKNENPAKFRNKTGKFVDHVFIDSVDHVIVDKSEWYVEELFNVYGYNPKTDRKTYAFILNNFIVNNPDTGDAMKRIMVYNNKLLIEYTEDFDFILCRDKQQCMDLYDRLETDIAKLNKKYIVFMGMVNTESSPKWLDRLQEKTGWPRQACKRINNLY